MVVIGVPYIHRSAIQFRINFRNYAQHSIYIHNKKATFRTGLGTVLYTRRTHGKVKTTVVK